MKRKNSRIVKLLSALCLALAVTACATTSVDSNRPAAARPLWQSREQFVTIVPRESTTGKITPVNDHPLKIPPAELGRLLARPTVTPAGDEKQQPLFTATELKLLSEFVSAGLDHCSGSEEIVFAVYGYHTAILGLGREERVTTGRIFAAEGKLNLVLGMVQKRVNSNEDRRLAPFTPGSRFTPATLDVTITPAVADTAYLLKRADWLVFTPGQKPAELTTPTGITEQQGGKSIEERLLRLKGLREKNLITDEEYRSKRLQILNEL